MRSSGYSSAVEQPFGQHTAEKPGELAEARFILDAVADAVGASQVGLEAIARRLHGRPSLLVLDNLEHLDGASNVVAELLGRLEAVTMLVTSRAPVGIPGEHQWPVRPLSVPSGTNDDPVALAAVPSVQLLVGGIRAAEPAFVLSPDVASLAGDVCRRLDGLPLALELAAAQWRVRGPSGVLESVVADPLQLTDVSGARPAAHSSTAARGSAQPSVPSLGVG